MLKLRHELKHEISYSDMITIKQAMMSVADLVHNYYLYEKDGKISMIPCDYNLSFGTLIEVTGFHIEYMYGN